MSHSCQLASWESGVSACFPSFGPKVCSDAAILSESSKSEAATSLCSSLLSADTYLSFLKSPSLILIACLACSIATRVIASSSASLAMLES